MSVGWRLRSGRTGAPDDYNVRDSDDNDSEDEDDNDHSPPSPRSHCSTPPPPSHRGPQLSYCVTEA